MQVELDKKDLLSLVKGTSPSYEQMVTSKVKPYGSYSGGFNDHWSWNSNLDKLSEVELWSLYKYLKST